MTKIKLRNSFFLLLAAAIWGFAFAFQRMGGESMGPYTFNVLRSFIGFLVVQPVVKIAYGKLRPGRDTLVGGILCGITLTLATNLQQLGIMYTTPGKSGFITASYMIMVAFIELLLGRKTAKIILISVLLGVFGLYLICMPENESLTMNKGDILSLCCAFFYAVQILIIDHYGDRVESVKMSAIQFLVCGILTAGIAFWKEAPALSQVKDGLIPLLYVGIMSTGVAYSLEMVGMHELNPSVASLIMSLESVFSVIGEWVIFGSILSGKALFGCAIMFLAIVLSQIDTFGKKKSCTKTETNTTS